MIDLGVEEVLTLSDLKTPPIPLTVQTAHCKNTAQKDNRINSIDTQRTGIVSKLKAYLTAESVTVDNRWVLSL